MQIRLVSSLTPDDEARMAPRLLEAIGAVLDSMPISYSVQIETALGEAIHRNRRPAADAAQEQEIALPQENCHIQG